MSPVGYTIEVTALSFNATEQDVFDFFSHCGPVEHLEILRSGQARIAYVTFRDAYALETAVLLSGAVIVDQRVCITPWGNYTDKHDPWSGSSWNQSDYSSSTVTQSRQFVSTPSEALFQAQEVVITMMAKGYDLGKDVLSRAKAFDESHNVSATAVSKVAELSNRIGLTDKISVGVQAAKSVDEKFQIVERTKSAASITGRTAVAAATTVVNSSYFLKGALWVSDVLSRASKAAADLGTQNNNRS